MMKDGEQEPAAEKMNGRSCRQRKGEKKWCIGDTMHVHSVSDGRCGAFAL